MQLHGWGRYPRHESELVNVMAPDEVPALVASRSSMIARGNGRAYGDAAIGERATLATRGLNRMKSFNPATGCLTVEAGVLLGDVLQTFVPRGFFPPVVPGTKLVTVGGMIAADVHGKNHHRDGGFGSHVQEFKLVLPGGKTVTCSPRENRELFDATVGGMGLTGVIVEATFTMKPIETGWIMQRTTVAGDLAAALKALDAAQNATYSVAWIDCLARGTALGRSLVFAGEHAMADEVRLARPKKELFPPARRRRLRVPIDLPACILHRASVAAFNEVYFRLGSRRGEEPFLVHWEPYFFPLDAIEDWNRIYGRRGFVQHQCVVPTGTAPSVLGEILERVTLSGKASFLAVLKKMGRAGGVLSFPMEGYTLALDLQVADDVFALLDDIDRIVAAAGGRLYLAKDARQTPRTFEAGYPRLGEFKDIRRSISAEGCLTSQLSRRLAI
jgi:FAD/FMN-containing dehydrogenase